MSMHKSFWPAHMIQNPSTQLIVLRKKNKKKRIKIGQRTDGKRVMVSVHPQNMIRTLGT